MFCKWKDIADKKLQTLTEFVYETQILDSDVDKDYYCVESLKTVKQNCNQWISAVTVLLSQNMIDKRYR